jgi:cytochrome P450
LLAAGPVWKLDGTGVAVVSSYHAIEAAVGRPEEFSSTLKGLIHRDEEGLPAIETFADETINVLATADPPRHTLHRSLVFSTAIRNRMQSLSPEIGSATRACLKEAIASGTCDFMSSVANVVPAVVVCRLLGVPHSESDRVTKAAFDSTAMLAATGSQSELRETMVRSAEVQSWLESHLEQATDEATILGAVAAAVDAGSITKPEGLVILHTLLSAGGESTTALIGNVVGILCGEPELQRQLRRAPHLIPAFIEEVLRLEPSFRYHMRSVVVPATLEGVELFPGTLVLLLWAAANRDPHEFERPTSLLLDRPAPRNHLGFGRGLHFCVGAALARLETRIVIELLLASTLDISYDDNADPTRVNSLMVRRYERLPVILTS